MNGSYIFFVYTHWPRRKICGPMSFPDEKARTTPNVSDSSRPLEVSGQPSAYCQRVRRLRACATGPVPRLAVPAAALVACAALAAAGVRTAAGAVRAMRDC